MTKRSFRHFCRPFFLKWMGAGGLQHHLPEKEMGVMLTPPLHITEYLIPNGLWYYFQQNSHSNSFASFTRKVKLPAREQEFKYINILVCSKEKNENMRWQNSDEIVVWYKVNFTASRHAWSWIASSLSREDMQPSPDNPLAKAITVSLVLVSPSTCSKIMQNIGINYNPKIGGKSFGWHHIKLANNLLT